jgi:hypothetical protein
MNPFSRKHIETLRDSSRPSLLKNVRTPHAAVPDVSECCTAEGPQPAVLAGECELIASSVSLQIRSQRKTGATISLEASTRYNIAELDELCAPLTRAGAPSRSGRPARRDALPSLQAFRGRRSRSRLGHGGSQC